MNRPRPFGKSSPDEQVACTSCGTVMDFMDLDRLLWCAPCRLAARQRAALWGWGIGLALGALVAAWVWWFVRPTDLVLGGWIATVIAGVWTGSRLGRVAAYGVIRATTHRDRPAL